MHSTRTCLATVAALLWLIPGAPRAQLPGGSDGVVVIDFATGPNGAAYAPNATGELRRGVTSTVRIVRPLIDVVPDGQINVSGGAALSGPITHGRTSTNVGFVQMSVAVPDGQAVGSTVTINVGAADHFPFRVVRTGMITSVTFDPNPATIQGGTSFLLTVQGQDLGSPAPSQLTCHDVSIASRSGTAFSAKLARTAGCTSLGPFTFVLQSRKLGDPGEYATSQGVKSFSFGPYQAPPPQVFLCTPAPGIGAPVIITPLDNQVQLFSPLTDSIQTVPVRWHRNTDTGVPAPLNEWIVKSAVQQSGAPLGETVVKDTAATLSLPVPGGYVVTIAAKNCWQTAPARSVSFQLLTR